MKLFRQFSLIPLLPANSIGIAQETDNWDNQLFAGNKVVYGQNKWKYSGELQFRMKDNMQSLDNWYLEGVATYLPSKYWEVVPFPVQC